MPPLGNMPAQLPNPSSPMVIWKVLILSTSEDPGWEMEVSFVTKNWGGLDEEAQKATET